MQKSLISRDAEIPRNFNSLNLTSPTAKQKDTNISNLKSKTTCLPSCKINATNSQNGTVSATKEKTSMIQHEAECGKVFENEDMNQTISGVIDENFYSR